MELLPAEMSSDVTSSSSPDDSLSTSVSTTVHAAAKEAGEKERKLSAKFEGRDLTGSPSFRFYFQGASTIFVANSEEVLEKPKAHEKPCSKEESYPIFNPNQGSVQKNPEKEKGKRFKLLKKGHNVIYNFLISQNCCNCKHLQHSTTHARIAPQPLSEKDA